MNSCAEAIQRLNDIKRQENVKKIEKSNFTKELKEVISITGVTYEYLSGQ